MTIVTSWMDHLIITIDNGLRTLCAEPVASRPNPADTMTDVPLTDSERKKSAALMRVNHTGEICAQALYYGQATVARSPQARAALLTAAAEETDHLAWCQTRIEELNDRPSYLNPLWYLGAFTIGVLAGAISDKLSLGFVVETERQVECHLANHLQQLSADDEKSRKILQQMSEDEAHHATVALGAGAAELPSLVKEIMKMLSKVMTTTSYYL